MAGKYKITAEVVLATNVEPDGYFEAYDALEFEDTSSFYGEDVHATGSCEFIVEADSEDEATEKAREILDNLSFHSNDIEWEIEDTSIEHVECIEEPMDMARAKTIILDWIQNDPIALQVSTEMREAIRFVVEELLTP